MRILKSLKCIPWVLFGLVCSCGRPNEHDIDNKLTSEHRKIGNSGRLFIVPPKGFEKATEYIGFEKNDSTFLTVHHILSRGYYQDSAGFSIAAQEKWGFKVIDYREIHVGPYPGKLIHLAGLWGNFSKHHVLIFGNKKFQVLLDGLYSKNDTTSGNQLLATIRSVYYKTP